MAIVVVVHDQFTEDGIVLDNALAFWVHRVYQAGRNEMYRAFRARGLEMTPEQWMILVRLWENEGQSQTDLCASTFRDRPTMSRILEGMEARGWVVRRADRTDARVRLVHLTAEGRRLRKLLVPVARDIVDKMLAGISAADLDVTRATLKRIFVNLDT